MRQFSFFLFSFSPFYLFSFFISIPCLQYLFKELRVKSPCSIYSSLLTIYFFLFFTLLTLFNLLVCCWCLLLIINWYKNCVCKTNYDLLIESCLPVTGQENTSMTAFVFYFFVRSFSLYIKA